MKQPLFRGGRVTPPSRSILGQSELQVYIDNFGTRKGDPCLVTDCDGKQVSLAVQKANYVVKMYEQVGFRTVDENGQDILWWWFVRCSWRR